MNNPHPSPLIYLKDIKFTQLKLIIDFIYLGLCQVPTEDVNEFIAVGGQLHVEGLMEQVKYSCEEKKEYGDQFIDADNSCEGETNSRDRDQDILPIVKEDNFNSSNIERGYPPLQSRSMDINNDGKYTDKKELKTAKYV